MGRIQETDSRIFNLTVFCPTVLSLFVPIIVRVVRVCTLVSRYSVRFPNNLEPDYLEDLFYYCLKSPHCSVSFSGNPKIPSFDVGRFVYPLLTSYSRSRIISSNDSSKEVTTEVRLFRI